jgi:hypothetical protein
MRRGRQWGVGMLGGGGRCGRLAGWLARSKRGVLGTRRNRARTGAEAGTNIAGPGRPGSPNHSRRLERRPGIRKPAPLPAAARASLAHSICGPCPPTAANSRAPARAGTGGRGTKKKEGKGGPPPSRCMGQSRTRCAQAGRRSMPLSMACSDRAAQRVHQPPCGHEIEPQIRGWQIKGVQPEVHSTQRPRGSTR